MMKQIGEVLSVKLESLGEEGYRVEAIGRAPTGWKRPALISSSFISNGVLEYRFEAEPPPKEAGTMSAQVLKNLTATATFGQPGTDIRGLKRVAVTGILSSKAVSFPPR